MEAVLDLACTYKEKDTEIIPENSNVLKSRIT